VAVGGPGEIGSVLSRKGKEGGILLEEGVGGKPSCRPFESEWAELGSEYWN
jgi:hypothetical protein